MRFGVNTYIWTSQFLPRDAAILPEIRRRGFEGVEIPIFSPAGFPSAELRRLFEQNGLECTVCSVIPSGLSLGSEDAAIRQKTIAHVRECVQAAAECGSKLFAGPIYTPVGYLPGRRRTEDEWKRVIESVQCLADTLSGSGVTLAIEPLNRFETYFLNTAADAVKLCDQVGHPNMGVLFDTFHANIEEKDLAASVRALGPRLKHFHASENDRGTPGSGHVDWDGCFAALREIGYSGWITIESFGFAQGELSAAASIWRDLAASPEEIAFEGIAFLKRLASRA